MNISERAKGLIAINITAVIIGTAALYGKLDIAPAWIVGMRTTLAAVTLIILGGYRDIRKPVSRELFFTLILTSIILTVHWLVFYAALKVANVAIVTLTFATFPLFTVLAEALHHHRRPRLIEIAAALSIVIAVGLIMDPHNGGKGSLIGGAAGLFCAITYALFWHFNKKLSREMPLTQISIYQNAIVALILLFFLPLSSPMPHRPVDWMWLVLLGTFNTALMFQLYLYAFKRISASACSGFIALEPIYAIIFAAIIFHEPITVWTVVSAILIIGASFTLSKIEQPE